MTILAFETLKKRSQFLRVRGGARYATKAFLMEAKLRPPILDPDGQKPCSDNHPALFGFTVTKRLGNAVVRNRIRRRLKSAIAEVAGTNAKRGCDYVIVARRAALAMPYRELQKNVTDAFANINRRLEKRRVGNKKR